VLFGLGGLANLGKSEAVLPAYLVGMAPALSSPDSRNYRRIRSICFAFLTPFLFSQGGSLIEAHALVTGVARSLSRDEDGDEVFRYPALDAVFQIRAA
jgi:Kef-type K+ transport system membrane component KefB